MNGCYEDGGTAIELTSRLAPDAKHASGMESVRNRVSWPAMELYWETGTGLTIGRNSQNNFVQFEYASHGTPVNLIDKHNTVLEAYTQNFPSPILPDLATYSNDGAAAAGGLASGAVYQTSSGELRVKL